MRRAVSVCLTAVIMMLSVAIPLMERADLANTEAAESQHDPSRCRPTHDHTICAQFRANLSAPAPSSTQSPTLTFTHVLTTPASAENEQPAFAEGPPSRAPPLA